MTSRLLAIAVFLGAAAAAVNDVVFEVPLNQYRIAFAAARGGCLANITDTITGLDVLAAPLTVELGEEAFCSAPADLAVHAQNETFLDFSTSRGLGVVVTFADNVVSMTYTFAKAAARRGTAAIALTTPSIHNYAFVADDTPTPTLGNAHQSLGVICVSNWLVQLACAPGTQGCSLAGRFGAQTDVTLQGAPLGFTATFERLI